VSTFRINQQFFESKGNMIVKFALERFGQKDDLVLNFSLVFNFVDHLLPIELKQLLVNSLLRTNCTFRVKNCVLKGAILIADILLFRTALRSGSLEILA
jgi:hypothetical protein